VTKIVGKERLARPDQEMMSASWFLRTTPLPPGLTTPELQATLCLLGEK
jgi:hypothetical protein